MCGWSEKPKAPSLNSQASLLFQMWEMETGSTARCTLPSGPHYPVIQPVDCVIVATFLAGILT